MIERIALTVLFIGFLGIVLFDALMRALLTLLGFILLPTTKRKA